MVPMRRSKKNHHNNGKRRVKNNNKKLSDGNTSSSGGEMDDIVAQLQRQRERQKQKKKDNLADVSPAPDAKVEKKSKKRETNPSIKQEIGDFRFDPISNRYLPKLSFNKLDRNEAQQQAKNVSIDRLRWGKRNSIADEDVRRVLFHGSALDYSCPLQNTHTHKKKTKKQHDDNKSDSEQQYHAQQQIPCSDRIVHLLTTSLQYATNSHKRNAIANILGPRTLARGATVVPSAVSGEMLASNTKRRSLDQQSVPIVVQQLAATVASKLPSSSLNQKWYSLLFPMRTNVNDPSDDYICKSYLPPRASTFDIQAYPNSIPSVVTTADRELFCRQKYSIPTDGRVAFQSDAPYDEESAWDLSVVTHIDVSCQCVKFSPKVDHIGILGQDIDSLGYYFVFKRFDLDSTNSEHLVSMDGQINNFCFSPNDHNKFAFVRGPDNESGLSYLDISAGRELIFPKRKTSEAISVEYLGDQVLCGYRNGSVTLNDERGNSRLSTTVMSSFGSTTSVHPLQDGNSVVVKGSFGSCKVLDVRKFQNNTNSGFSDRATVMDLTVPLSLVHKTKSTRCTGVALDPTETIVVCPFAGDDNLSCALWCLKTGKFLRSVDLGTTGNNTKLPPFCELSSKTTSGFAIRDEYDSTTLPLITKESDFGVWFKSTPNPLAPPYCGSIHHLSFPK